LPVLKHRQLARQVGAFGEFATESSADLDNMIFSAALTFIFGSEQANFTIIQEKLEQNR